MFDRKVYIVDAKVDLVLRKEAIERLKCFVGLSCNEKTKYRLSSIRLSDLLRCLHDGCGRKQLVKLCRDEVNVADVRLAGLLGGDPLDDVLCVVFLATSSCLYFGAFYDPIDELLASHDRDQLNIFVFQFEARVVFHHQEKNGYKCAVKR